MRTLPRLLRLAAAAALRCVAALACRRDGADAAGRHLAPIINIRVPESAPVLDTVRVAFDYWHFMCDTLEAVETRQTRSGVAFAVWVRATGGPCPTSATIGHVLHLVLPVGPVDYSVIFREPTGPDSVRTIHFLWARAPAP